MHPDNVRAARAASWAQTGQAFQSPKAAARFVPWSTSCFPEPRSPHLGNGDTRTFLRVLERCSENLHVKRLAQASHRVPLSDVSHPSVTATVVPHFIALYRYCVFTNGRLVATRIKQVCRHHFSSSISSLPTSVSHFDNNHNISNFFIIIIIFVTVICDL